MPPPSAPAYAKFADLRAAAAQRDEKLRREALREKFGEREDVPFVASLMRLGNQARTEEVSFVVHTENTPTLLPRAEWVVFRRVDLAKKTATTLACGRWDAVYEPMQARWKETPLWPRRWLATDLPTEAELRQLGCANPLLAADMGVARSIQ
jgi:hypothetical protein